MTHMQRRHVWTAVHRYCGLVSMAFLLVASLTGVALSFTSPLDEALNPDLFTRNTGGPINPLAAARAYAALHPDLIIVSIPTRVTAHETVQIGVAARPGGPPLANDEVFLDDEAGHVRGARLKGPGWDRRHIVEGMFELHYTLLAGDWGRWLMGLVATLWLIGNVVGVYLTFPLRGAFWKQWRKSWSLKLSSPLPRLLLDLHRSSALWLLGGVLILSLTSVCMNFFGEVFAPSMQALSPARPSIFDRPPPGAAASAPRIDPARALAVARVAGRDTGWLPAKVSYVPDRNVYSVMFTDDGWENYHRLGPVSLIIDGATGRVVERDDPYGDSAGRKLSRALYPLHTGKMAGVVGVAIDVVLGLATIEMIGTGCYLWLKRRRPRVALRRARRARYAAAR